MTFYLRLLFTAMIVLTASSCKDDLTESQKWEREFKALAVQSAVTSFPDGSSHSQVCVKHQDSACTRAEMVRLPFDRRRVIYPLGPMPINIRSSEALIIPFIEIYDENQPEVKLIAHFPFKESTPFLQSAGISVVSNGTLIHEQTSINQLLYNRNLEIELSKQDLSDLRQISENSALMIRLPYYNDILNKKYFALSSNESKKFAASVAQMIRIHDSLAAGLPAHKDQ